MAKITEILDYFESFAPAASAMDFDNCGLLVGDIESEITSSLVSLDITPEVVEEAVQKNCGLIISHHPVIFNPIKRLSAASVPYLLAKNGIAAICMHTNLDLSESFGVNTCLAAEVGLTNLLRSDKGDCLFVGELAEAVSAEVFAQKVKEALNCDGLRFTDLGKNIKTVALCSGSGGDEIFAAAEEGADALLTGEIKHHEINSANELGVCVIDVGHFKSEDVVILPLIKKLKGKFPDISFTKSSVYSDKIKFL